jgi:hypothetical protein
VVPTPLSVMVDEAVSIETTFLSDGGKRISADTTTQFSDDCISIDTTFQ